MTEKEIVAKAIAFYEGGGKPGWKNELCLYFIEENRRCAIGAVLGSETAMALRGNEAPSVRVILSSIRNSKNLIRVKQELEDLYTGGSTMCIDFYASLQVCHDNACCDMKSEDEFLDLFKKNLRDYGLLN